MNWYVPDLEFALLEQQLTDPNQGKQASEALDTIRKLERDFPKDW